MFPLVFLIFFSNPLIYKLEEIVVTATRYPAALSDVALATVVIGKDEIESQCPRNAGDLLHTYAGIDIKDYGTPGSVSSLSLRGIPSNGTLILINGHPLNSLTTGMADLSSLDINTVERVEIIKGPASTLYGANALGGVVNIVTMKYHEKHDLKFDLTSLTTDFNDPIQSKKANVNVGFPIRHASLGFSGAYTASSGDRSNGDVTAYNFNCDFAHKSNKSCVSASIAYSDRDFGIPGPMPLIDSLHSVPLFGDTTAMSLFDREKDRCVLGDARIEWQISSDMRWNTTLSLDRRLIQFHTTYGGWFGDTIAEDYDYLTHKLGLTTVAAVVTDDEEFIFGVDAYYDTLRTQKESEQTGDTIWHASSYTVGAWYQFKKRLNSVTLMPSIRVDRNSEFGYFLSTGFGLVAALAPTFLLKLSVGEAFRAPTFNDLYWPHSGNPELKPEHGWAYEVRLEKSVIPVLFAAISLFKRDVHDRISWIPGENGMWQPKNVNYLSAQGVDIEIRSYINKFVDIDLEGTFLDARQKNNEIVYDYYDWVADTGLTVINEIERDAAFTPRYSLALRICFHLPYAFEANVAACYSAKRVNYYSNNNDYPNVTRDEKVIDPCVTLDINVSKDLFNYLSLAVGAKNVLDTEYAKQFGNTMDDLNYPMPRRSLFAKILLNH